MNTSVYVSPCLDMWFCSNGFLCVFVSSGMVLVRTELGQLVMVPQQALAQAQAQNNNLSPRPATSTAGTPFRVTTPQVRHRNPCYNNVYSSTMHSAFLYQDFSLMFLRAVTLRDVSFASHCHCSVLLLSLFE